MSGLVSSGFSNTNNVDDAELEFPFLGNAKRDL